MDPGDQPPHRAYLIPDAAKVNKELYTRLSESGWSNIARKLTVPKQKGLAWELRAGQICRVVVAYGSQVGDLNLWNLHDSRERFYSGKTRQIHRSHLSTYDRLWSCLPYLRPMATISKDSMAHYGIDQQGCSVHGVIGTRCDPYTIKMITGKMGNISCHQNLMEAIKPWNLQESDVHDVFNIFMRTGFTKDTHAYCCMPSPARVGDHIEFVAEMDLLVALSACPFGDVSIPVGNEVPDEICFPLDVYIGQPSPQLIEEWKTQKLS